MSLLNTFANKYVGRALTHLGDHLTDAAMGIPTDPATRELVHRHDQWLATAQLNVRYYAADSAYTLVGDNAGAGPIRLTCSPTWVFTRRTAKGLYTDTNFHSYKAFLRAGFRGLTTAAPPKPSLADYKLLNVTWELSEVEYAEEPLLVGAR